MPVKPFLQKLGPVLRSPWLPLLLSLASILLTLPALGAGWLMDDWQHRAALLGPGRVHGLDPLLFPSGRWSGLFQFFDGNPEHMRHAMEVGQVPWWTLPELRAAFFRPLTAATHWLDYQWWPNSAWLMHLHSLLWLGLLVGMAALAYRRFLGPTSAAGLAALAYALDDAHGMPAAWIANRNALVAGAFGIAALLLHDRWRREGWRPGAYAAPALFLLALLAGESGAGALAYLLAYALCLEQTAWRSRLLSLLPYGVLLLVWRAAALHFGVGIHGMDFYLDPGAEPWRFLQAIPQRVPVLLLGQWSPVPADVGLVLPARAFRVLWWMGVGVAAGLAFLLAPLVRRCPTSRFFLVGMLLSLLPICATYPSDRLLVFAGLGGMGLLGQFLAALWRRDPVLPTQRLWRAVAWTGAVLLGITHLVLAPLRLPDQASLNLIKKVQIPLDLPDDGTLERNSLVILNGPLALAAAPLPLQRAVQGLPVPRHTLVLFASLAAMQVTRTDDRTLLLRPRNGYLGAQLDALFRGPRHPLARGEQVRLEDAVLTVDALTPDGRPAVVSCRFSSSLEDGSRIWLCWRDGRYQPTRPPDPGQTLAFPPALPSW